MVAPIASLTAVVFDKGASVEAHCAEEEEDDDNAAVMSDAQDEEEDGTEEEASEDDGDEANEKAMEDAKGASAANDEITEEGDASARGEAHGDDADPEKDDESEDDRVEDVVKREEEEARLPEKSSVATSCSKAISRKRWSRMVAANCERRGLS